MPKATVSVLSLLLSSAVLGLAIAPAAALPPPEDIPEEVLRTQITLQGRSPETGELLSASEYAEQNAARQAAINEGGYVPPQVVQLVTLLRIRKALRLVLPIIP